MALATPVLGKIVLNFDFDALLSYIFPSQLFYFVETN
jgi:hypothetical protein